MIDTSRFNDGYGSVSREDLDALLKSLQTGTSAYNAAPNTLTGGTALMTQSLDATLRSVTFDLKTLKLWPMIAKDRAYNTVEEYDRITSYGETSNGSFFDADAGTAPTEHTADYSREIQTVRYMGTTRVVSHPLTLVRPAHGPVVAREIKNGTMYILQNLERQLFEANAHFQNSSGDFDGDSADIPTNSAKFNGLDQQIRFGDTDTSAQYTGFEPYGGADSVVYDLAGNAPDEDDIEAVANRTLENFGAPTHLIMDHKTHRDLSTIFYPKERINAMGVQSGAAGFVLSKFMSSAGELAMVGDVFLRPKQGNLAAAQSGAPATPSNSASSTEADSDATLAGTFYYRVSAINNSGESLASAERSQAVTAGNRVTLTIDAGTSGALYYAVYRSATSGSGWKFIGYVKDSSAGGGGGATFKDAGKKEPGLGNAYLLQMDKDNLVWKQLAPLMKMDLAITGPAYRFMNLLYGTPIVPAPLHGAIWDNIGRA